MALTATAMAMNNNTPQLQLVDTPVSSQEKKIAPILQIEEWVDEEDVIEGRLVKDLGLTEAPKVEDKDEKYLRYDEETRILTDERQALEYLLFRKGHDVNREPMGSELTVIGVEPDAPLMHQSVRNCAGLTYEQAPDKMMDEAAATNGLLLKHPNAKGNAYAVHPLLYTAVDDLCQRAGIYGRSIVKTVGTKFYGVLSGDERGRVFTNCLRLNHLPISELIRDGKIARLASAKYQVLDAAEGYYAVKDYLADAYGAASSFIEGEVTAEHYTVLFSTGEDTTDISMKLQSFGVDVSGGVYLNFRYDTSDVGNAAMRVVPVLTIGAMNVVMGEGVRVEHVLGNDIDKLKKALPELAKSLQEAEDEIEQLGNTDIQNVAGCFQKIVKGFSRLTKANVDAEIKEILMVHKGDYAGTAIDVYMTINRAIARQCTTANGFNTTEYIQLTESASRFLKYNFASFDGKVVDED